MRGKRVAECTAGGERECSSLPAASAGGVLRGLASLGLPATR